ncbi:MAG TPA: hypothetical protein VFY04_07210 [Solirubrobacterales bacterium]|nr:hypothetical protein [Solirubrobacterales bacterium]
MTRLANRRRPLALLAGAAALLTLALVPAFASGATIVMKADKKGLRFVAPKSVAAGEELKVVNQSDPRKFGPHTFSLVTKGSLPKTPNARKRCFAKGHICRSIARWHGVKGNGPVKENPAEAGLAGWDTLGNNSREGDSWFTGNKPGTSFAQPVTFSPPVTAGATDTRIYFLCAIHPWMQGSTVVTPSPVPTG